MSVPRKANQLLGEEIVRSKRKGGGFKKKPKQSLLRPRNDASAHSVGVPRNVKHQVHVNTDFNWDGDFAKLFKIVKKLGEGAFGAVYLGRHEETGQTFAMKELPVNGDQSSLEEIRKEIDILRKCRHANIVCYFGTMVQEEHLYILMDFCDLGSLREVIEMTNLALTEAETVEITKCTLSGLVYLHHSKIIHRDVKGANILVNMKGEVKITDFGVSDALGGSTDLIGSPYWMAPEVVQERPYDARCDIWSLGITVIEMADGVPPMNDTHPMIAMRRVPTNPPPRLECEEECSPEMVSFVERCLVKDARNRPSGIDLLMDDWLQQAAGPSVLRERLINTLKAKKKREKERNGEVKESAGPAKENSIKQVAYHTILIEREDDGKKDEARAGSANGGDDANDDEPEDEPEDSSDGGGGDYSTMIQNGNDRFQPDFMAIAAAMKEEEEEQGEGVGLFVDCDTTVMHNENGEAEIQPDDPSLFVDCDTVVAHDDPSLFVDCDTTVQHRSNSNAGDDQEVEEDPSALFVDCDTTVTNTPTKKEGSSSGTPASPSTPNWGAIVSSMSEGGTQPLTAGKSDWSRAKVSVYPSAANSSLMNKNRSVSPRRKYSGSSASSMPGPAPQGGNTSPRRSLNGSGDLPLAGRSPGRSPSKGDKGDRVPILSPRRTAKSMILDEPGDESAPDLRRTKSGFGYRRSNNSMFTQSALVPLSSGSANATSPRNDEPMSPEARSRAHSELEEAKGRNARGKTVSVEEAQKIVHQKLASSFPGVKLRSESIFERGDGESSFVEAEENTASLEGAPPSLQTPQRSNSAVEEVPEAVDTPPPLPDLPPLPPPAASPVAARRSGVQPIPPARSASLDNVPVAAKRASSQPKMVDPNAFFETVRLEFLAEPEEFKKFVAVMKQFKTQEISTPDVVERVKTIFQGRPNLLVGFNQFLPKEFRIQVADLV